MKKISKRIAAGAVAVVAMMATTMPIVAEEITILVDGQEVYWSDQAPVLIEGRTMVPARDMFNALGYSVGWDGATQTVRVYDDVMTLDVQIDSMQMIENEGETSLALDVPAQLLPSGRTVVPLRAISEATGATVSWDAPTSTVSIQSGQSDSLAYACRAFQVHLPQAWEHIVHVEVDEFTLYLYPLQTFEQSNGAEGLMASIDVGNIPSASDFMKSERLLLAHGETVLAVSSAFYDAPAWLYQEMENVLSTVEPNFSMGYEYFNARMHTFDRSMEFKVFSSYLADNDRVLEGQAVRSAGDTESIQGELCTLYSVGTNHDEKFTAEQHYALSPTGTLYELDILTGEWVTIHWNLFPLQK